VATNRQQLAATLAVHDREALKLVLRASDVDARGADTARELADRLADAVWWNYNTPLGYVADRTSFEDIVRHLARKLGVADRLDPDRDEWGQLQALTWALVESIPADGITVEALGDGARARLHGSWAAPVGFGASASGSFGSRWVSGRVLALLRSPIGRLLPHVPVVGPWVNAVRMSVGAVYAVSGPVGIALTILSVNSALSTNYRRLVPLVLGIGALGPQPLADVVEVRSQDTAPR
jgi:hypothetical protein